MGKKKEKGIVKMSKTIKEWSKQYQLRHVAGRYYLLDMEQSGMPYKRPMEMNAIGAEIWNLIQEGYTAEEIAQKLAEEYEANVTDIREDVLQFQKSLTMYGVGIGE